MIERQATDVDTLLTQQQDIQSKLTDALQKSKEKLEKESKKSPSTLRWDDSKDTSADDGIVDINAGGEIIQTHRSTLCLVPDSMLSQMFSGDDEVFYDAQDSQGRLFLDHDPELVRLMVNHLRIKRIEDPLDPIDSPEIPQGKKREFHCMLRYFGLASFFYPVDEDSLDFSTISVVEPYGSAVGSTHRRDGKLQLTYNGSKHYFVACKPSLPSAKVCTWKVTIDNLPSDGWVCLGVIGNARAKKMSYSDPTSYGWAGPDQIYRQGRSDRIGESCWSGFVSGERLYFRFDGQRHKLTMFSVEKNAAFSIDNIAPTAEKYLHIDFYSPTTRLTLEPLSPIELDTLKELA
mmetsp:Transcript_17816/g.26363  ORF Transcript_17816/g.26363 Transcript_17816/m.26363 type:complete len:347 (-) Transcript_17816:166-1206(-)|eukprot:CAMPEP_0194049538 /NCGR_PEP_ID=MMETSP0009_2-20130614/30740_1 /TAXON_ID=210454 /ORGANISM="Grammatophora oceanica, Strain CCMP 410" /LENGTH=346 /DNA_ID=CAMNT_0038695721 /DNA_START=113 /DNA_END=1153 /DNA_ORIENTATION=-